MPFLAALAPLAGVASTAAGASTAGAALAGTALAGTAAGVISGASDKRTRDEVEVEDANAFEEQLRQQQQSLFQELQGLGDATGLGEADVQAAVGAQRDVADLLKQLQQTAGLPGQQDIRQSQDIAQQLFAPQRVALQQAFEDQTTSARREAARLGRDLNDPILRNRLAQEQTRQGALLEAQQGASAQELALQLPGQRLQFAQGRADVLGGLAQQAFQNRSSLLSLGNTLAQQERDFRFNTATRTNVQEGSLGQAFAGGFAGLGSGLSAGVGLASAAAQNRLRTSQTELFNRTQSLQPAAATIVQPQSVFTGPIGNGSPEQSGIFGAAGVRNSTGIFNAPVASQPAPATRGSAAQSLFGQIGSFGNAFSSIMSRGR